MRTPIPIRYFNPKSLLGEAHFKEIEEELGYTKSEILKMSASEISEVARIMLKKLDKKRKLEDKKND